MKIEEIEETLIEETLTNITNRLLEVNGRLYEIENKIAEKEETLTNIIPMDEFNDFFQDTEPEALMYKILGGNISEFMNCEYFILNGYGNINYADHLKEDTEKELEELEEEQEELEEEKEKLDEELVEKLDDLLM